MQLIGKTIGRYRIVDLIGSGGMATVYKAYQPGLDRYVALKVLLREHCGTPEFQERFLGDAKAVARLSHPNILPVYDVGVEKGISYFVMKYASGKTLAEKMGRPLPYSRIHRYIDHIASALDHAHQRGIIHRDVKPANILMEDEWTFLTDFGIAKIMASGSALTCTGEILGTPTYISPEQAAGKKVDPRTDIYSLGVILYKMITGRAPFKGETPMGVMYKHIHEPPPMPNRFRPDIPEEIEQVVFTALAKDPSDRFETAGQMASALEKAVAGAPAESAEAVSDPQGKDPGKLKTFVPARQALVSRADVPGNLQKGRSDPPKTGQAGKRRIIPAIAILITIGVAIAGLVYSYSTTAPSSERGTSVPTSSSPSKPEPFKVQQAPIQEQPQTGSLPTPTEPRARLAVDPKKASLRLVSQPEARAYINGRDQGATPCDMVLALGARHDIRLERYGYEVYEDSIALISDKPQTLTVSLDRQKPVADLNIESIHASPDELRISRTGGMKRVDIAITFAVSDRDSNKGMVVSLSWIILKNHAEIGRGESFSTCTKPGTYTETYYFDRNWPAGRYTLRGEAAVGGKTARKEVDFLVREEDPAEG